MRFNDLVNSKGMQRVDVRELRRYRQFYLSYPQIRESLTPEFKLSGRTILERLSFTHIAELLQIDDPLKRFFYEVECVIGVGQRILFRGPPKENRDRW